MIEIIRTTEQFVRKAIAIHGDRYDYSQFDYKGGRTKGIIICPVHGPFLKTPDKHIHRKQGCKECSSEAKAERLTFTLEAFVTKARKVHGDRYDYSQFVYVHSAIKGKIRCVEHDIIFEQTPGHHLSGHCGCEKCIGEKNRRTQVERYGAEHHSQTPEFAEKVKRTSRERFGADHYSQTAEYAERAKQSNLARFGVDFASQSPDFRQRVRQTNQARYGAPHANMSHIPIDGFNILSPAVLRELMTRNSIREAADIVGITESTLGKYCQRHGIEISQSTEDAICTFLRNHNVVVQRNIRTIIKGGMDLVLPDYLLGIEFCGLFWHAEWRRPKTYHLNKLRKAECAGYRLITIFEDEWLSHRETVEKRLLYFLGKSERGKGARQLDVRVLSATDCRGFFERYHLQGPGTGGYVRYGAFDNDTLVAAMSFARPRVAMGRTTGADELVRYATDGKNYPGIASRLFATYLREHQPEQVISYADRRWSDGGLYRQLGFQLVSETSPNYWYIDGRKREHRFNYRKDKIKHLVENGEQKTESQIMAELGRLRIWDCGSLKYLWMPGRD